MLKRRKIIIVLALVVMLLTIFTTPALANYYAMGRIVNGSYLGGYSQWVNPSLYTTYDYASGGFTGQVLWVSTQDNDPGYTWVEVGYTQGWQGQNITTLYWAEATPSYAEHKITSISVGSVGALHRYQIQYTSYNTWTAYVDYTSVGTSSQAPGSTTVDTGGEITNSYNNLTTTYPEYMQYLDSGTSTWNYWNGGNGTVTSSQNSPFIWTWRDSGTYKLGKDYR
ncbi:MAG: hypothetical protein ACYCX4_17245 [Bacillota bacterium]